MGNLFWLIWWQAARIIAQLLVVGSGVLIRAVSQAYRQAIVSKFSSFITIFTFLIFWFLQTIWFYPIHYYCLMKISQLLSNSVWYWVNMFFMGWFRIRWDGRYVSGFLNGAYGVFATFSRGIVFVWGRESYKGNWCKRDLILKEVLHNFFHFYDECREKIE